MRVCVTPELEDTHGRRSEGREGDDRRLQPIGAKKLLVRPTAHLYAVVM